MIRQCSKKTGLASKCEKNELTSDSVKIKTHICLCSTNLCNGATQLGHFVVPMFLTPIALIKML